MTGENAKDFLPLVQALADGKTIQFFVNNKWVDITDISFCSDIKRYRIKPKEEYVPFDTEEYQTKDALLKCAKEIIKKIYSHVFRGMSFMEINDYNALKNEVEQFLFVKV